MLRDTDRYDLDHEERYGDPGGDACIDCGEWLLHEYLSHLCESVQCGWVCIDCATDHCHECAACASAHEDKL